MYAVEPNIHVCSITETWLNEDSANLVVCGELTPTGYKLEHIARSSGNGGGVVILHRESLNVKELKPYNASHLKFSN